MIFKKINHHCFSVHSARNELLAAARQRRRHVFSRFAKILLPSVLLLSGCSEIFEPVNVYILPSGYQVGDVKSVLATPAVDEVVRLKPNKVHISTCLTTPPAKVIQFEIELQARLKTKITGGFFKTCPEI